MKIQIIGLSLLIAISGQHASAQTLGRRTNNFLTAIAQSPEQQDESTREIAKLLAAALVPTSKDAESRALSFLVNGPGLRAEETLEVTGLYMLGLSQQDFAALNELFWEVRIYFGSGVRRVLWVSTTTKAVKAVFP